ncbi:Ig-like domain-containing protein [Deinococcus irradiatisoli]|uniref:Ig-like domain-containing protein n=1 Tax=Deinococcus irradiatisoli TaxID=2202254 RepID=UPI0015E841EF|nr:Ig-like domain-containing protein [Deinococcus irradiatisoli]
MLDQSDKMAPSLKIQAPSAVSVQYALNGNPAQVANLSGNGSVMLTGLCPGPNTLVYSVKVGSAEVLSNQKSSFTLPDTAYNPSLKAVSLSVGSATVVTLPINEAVPLACQPKLEVKAAGSLPITVKSSAVEGAAGEHVIKAELLANAAGSGNIDLTLTWGGSTRTFSLPVSATATSDTPAPPKVAVTSLTVTPNPLNLQVGAASTLKTELQGTGTFSKTLSFKTENVDVATVDASGTVKAVAPGKTTLTVTPLETPAKAVQVPVTVTAAPSFQLVSQPSSLSITAGNSATFTLNMQAQNGYNGTATLSLPTLPSGVSASLSASTITPTAPVQVTLKAASSAPASTNLLVFKATDPANLNASATLGLQVNVAPTPAPTPDPTPTPSPPSDTTPPVISAVSPVDGSLILDNSVLVKANVNDLSAIASVTLSVNGVLVGNMKADADNMYQLTWDVSRLNSGTYQLLIQASDKAGNAAIWQGSVDLSRPAGGLQLVRRFTFDRNPTSNVAFGAGFGFVGAGRTLERFELGSSKVSALPLTNATIESVEVLGNQVYVLAADNTVTLVDPLSLSPQGTVTLPGDRTTGLKAGGGAVFVGTRAGLVMLSGTRSTTLSSNQVTALSADPLGGAYAAYVGGRIDSFNAGGILSAQGSSSGLNFLQIMGTQLYGGSGMHLYSMTPVAPLAREMSLSPAPGGTIVGMSSVAGTTVISDAAGRVTSMGGAQAQLDGAVLGAPAVSGNMIYVPTKNYSLYAVKVGGGSLDVVSHTENLGLVVAPTVVDSNGQVYYVSLNGVYVFKP